MSTNRNYYRAQARAAIAPRTRGQFASAVPPTSPQEDNSPYWSDLAARCRDRLPQELPWAELTTHLWPNPEYTPTWRETANAMTLATQAWNAGWCDLETLAAKLKAAFPA